MLKTSNHSLESKFTNSIFLGPKTPALFINVSIGWSAIFDVNSSIELGLETSSSRRDKLLVVFFNSNKSFALFLLRHVAMTSSLF